MAGIDTLAVILIIAFILAYILLFYAMIQAGTRGTLGWIATGVAAIIGVLLITFLIANINNIVPADWAQILILLGLVAVTGMYAWSTMKMAKEMREQRVMASRPAIVLKAVYEKDIWEGSTKDYFSHFEISSVGSTTAIEVEISLMDKEEMDRTHSIRQTYLKTGDSAIKFRPFNIANLDETTTYHIVCEYQDVFSNYPQKEYCQTRLPFWIAKSAEEGKIYVVAGELEFCEASEKTRIDAFSSRSKPK